MPDTPIIMWFRRDLRLGDNPALAHAAATGRPLVPVFVHDETVEAMGAAPRWRLGLALEVFARRLESVGSRLILRRGRAEKVLPALARETAAGGVVCGALYDPGAVARDRATETALGDAGLGWKAFPGHVLFPPDSVATAGGGFYKVFTPFWKAVRDRDVRTPMPTPRALKAPRDWPRSDRLADWRMHAGMKRGAQVVADHVTVGEAAAEARLAAFMADGIEGYARARNLVAVDGTSRLSENLTHGEISVRACWQAARQALEDGKAGAETFLKELVWRDFAHHLAWHTPRLLSENWRREWDSFPWSTDRDTSEVRAWQRGRTGIAFVDAAMRELYVTGFMHNRARMVAASFLTKHLMYHWNIGLDWFADTLIDWDPAANALGWQWTAGSGPDAAPFFRVFNPATQAEKFDPEGAYRRRWIAEGQAAPPATALAFFRAIPEGWHMAPRDACPEPVVALDKGRRRALAAFQNRNG